MKQGSCLILGGKGFVGSAIVAEARARGYEVIVVDKDEYHDAIGTRCDLLINANGNSKKFLARDNPALEFDLSVRSVQRALQDFKAARVVHLSTMDVYSDVSEPALNHEDSPIDITRQSPYGFHKYLAEQIVRHDADRWIIFRMAGFVGKGLWKNSIFDLLTGQALRVHPDSEYQYLNTQDLARAVFAVVASGADREVFNVAGRGLISLRSVAGMVPGVRLDPAWNSQSRERYELNIDKISRIHPLPRTEDTLRDFVRNWTSALTDYRPSPVTRHPSPINHSSTLP